MTRSDARKREAEQVAPTIEAVLAEHVASFGPISGTWGCPCGASATRCRPDGSLTSRHERAVEHAEHLADAIRQAGAR